MSQQSLELEPKDFVAICRTLDAAGRGHAKRTVQLRFAPNELLIEAEMGGGLVRTTGSFPAQLRVTYGVLSKAASLHRKTKQKDAWIKCVLDDELKEIRFTHGGFKAKFDT